MRETHQTGPRDADAHSAGTEPTPVAEFAEPLAQAALALLASFFRDRESLQAFLEEQVAALPEPRFLGLEYGEYRDVSEVLRLWETRAEYLDSAGRPKVLPQDGENSFTTLSRQAYPGLAVAVVLEALEKGHAVECVSGKVRLLSRTKLVKHADQAAHGRAALVSTRLLRSLVGNLDPQGDTDKLFERTVLGHGIPQAQLPAVKAFMLRHGQQYLEDMDDWLETLRTPDSEDTVSAGACLFLFTDPPSTRR
ncbi:MAG: hypothetical protein RJB26_524 [Pseudomonadota bacterium]